MNTSQLKKWTLLAFMVSGLMSCSQKEVTLGNLDVIPRPDEVVKLNDGSSFVIDESTTICYPEGNEKMKKNAEFLATYIKKITATEVNLSTKERDNAIVLSLDGTLTEDEGYELNVSKEQISLKGKTEAGVFYGIQTLHKALPVTDGTTLAAIPCGSVRDYPRFGYRGFMVDVGRHFFSVDYLKEIIDILALYNINYFHWHLTEDQGWRIEIKKYPKLTEIGSKRKGTIKERGSKELDGIPVSGYYTQEEAKEIVRYAAERYITVIPEIDMPGHMLAALASYPELGCTGGPYEVAANFGVFRNVLCGGNDQTLQFAKDVINEIMDIFPSPYIHIGGDECPKYHWKTCAKCQKKIRELGLKDSKEHTKENQLQAWFMGEVEKEIRKRGREMMAWNEILHGNPAKSTIVMAWTQPEACLKSIEGGYRTIACPIQHLYFSNAKFNQLRGLSSIDRVYSFEPVPEEATPEQKKNVMGAQGCIWTEWTKDSVKMEWQMLPRIAALAEIQWSKPENKNIGDFLERLRHHLELYKLYGYNYKEDIHEALNPNLSADTIDSQLPVNK
ncbi:beta-N-acetylhexosaminidase [Phocaeicola sp.]|uniref:beta-N-acetylhexosaminidase n=1 Tax=Phocaeicola sp. TaxID=2773926 RepID=UPI003A93EA48